MITGYDTANTLNGEAKLTFDGDKLTAKNSSGNAGIDLNVSSGTNPRLDFNTANVASSGIIKSEESGSGAIMEFHNKNSSGGEQQVITLKVNRNLQINDGDIELASGHGIDFSATANSSATGATMSNELLDDYEEGSWTPQIRKYVGGSFGTAAGMTDNGTVQRSTYTKIGNVVTLFLHWDGFQVSDANYAALGGLPFSTANSGGGGGTVGYTDAFTNNQNQGILVGSAGDNIYFYINSNAWNGWSTSSARTLYIQATYLTD